MLAGLLIGRYVVDVVGRRRVLVVSIILIKAGALMLFFAPSYPFIICASVVYNFANGMILNSSYLLLSETSLIR